MPDGLSLAGLGYAWLAACLSFPGLAVLGLAVLVRMWLSGWLAGCALLSPEKPRNSVVKKCCSIKGLDSRMG